MNSEGTHRQIENHQHDNRAIKYGLTITLKLDFLILKNSNNHTRHL
jgi:hypothetical protein